MLALTFAFLCAVLSESSPSPQHISRHDFFVGADPGIRLFVREVLAGDTTEQNRSKPILLVHGARVPGLASFDLDVPSGSLAADLAARGFAVYVMDVRGYGASSRPPEMDQPPTAHPPLVRTNEAA